MFGNEQTSSSTAVRPARPERKALKGKAYKAAHKARAAQLLQDTKLNVRMFSYVHGFNMVCLTVLVFLVSSCVVKGAYDAAWETGLSLYILGGGIIVLGVLFPAWRIRRSKKRQYETSVGTWWLVGTLAVLLGLFYIVTGFIMHVPTNYLLWHHLVSDKYYRDAFGRTGLEGVYTGLLMSYMKWDPVKYELKGTLGDRILRWAHWPNSLESDEQRPIRAWMMWVCPILMVALAALVFLGAWGLDQFALYLSATFHMHLPGVISNKIDHGLNFVFENWWVWLAGYAGSKFLAQIPAKGMIHQLQQVTVQHRLVKKQGHLRKASSLLWSTGWNLHLAIEYYEGVEAQLSADASRTIDQIEAYLRGLSPAQREAIYHGSAAFAQNELEARDPGIKIPLQILGALSPIFFVLGFFFVYAPLINEHLHTHIMPVLTHLG